MWKHCWWRAATLGNISQISALQSLLHWILSYSVRSVCDYQSCKSLGEDVACETGLSYTNPTTTGCWCYLLVLLPPPAKLGVLTCTPVNTDWLLWLRTNSRFPSLFSCLWPCPWVWWLFPPLLATAATGLLLPAPGNMARWCSLQPTACLRSTKAQENRAIFLLLHEAFN